MKQASFYCHRCQQMRLFSQQGINHVLHLLISIFLCGLWLPVWLIMTISEGNNPFHCQQCGFADSAKYLANPNLRQQEQERRQNIYNSSNGSENKILYIAGCIILSIFLIGVAIFLYQKTTEEVSTPKTEDINSLEAFEPQPATSAEKLKVAKEYLNKNYSDDKKRKSAIRFLKNIPPQSKEYPEAQKLLLIEDGKQKKKN